MTVKYYCKHYLNIFQGKMVASHSLEMNCNGKESRPRVEVTGILGNNQRRKITAMFDDNKNTFWHGTRLNPQLRSAVRISFKVSYVVLEKP